jgi:hypothetical protein
MYHDGEYPLLSGGVIGLLTASGIASDKTAAKYGFTTTDAAR